MYDAAQGPAFTNMNMICDINAIQSNEVNSISGSRGPANTNDKAFKTVDRHVKCKFVSELSKRESTTSEYEEGLERLVRVI